MARNIISSVRSPVVVILGATGAGKSKLALEIAAKYNGEIISADSMQIYKRLDIITNKVTAAEQKICPHHMLDFVDPLTSNYTVVNFRNTALPIIDDIFSRKRLPIVVGGTNYYIESLIWKLLVDIKEPKPDDSVLPPGECNGKDELSQPPGECNESDSSDSDLPPGECDENVSIRPRNTRDGQEMEKLHRKTTAELHQLLLEVDEERGKKVHPNDRRKILRALEVYYRDGCRMSAYLRAQHRAAGAEAGVSGPLRFPDTCIIWVQADQAVLDTRTDGRVEEMMEQGLIREMSEFHSEYNQARLTEHSEYNQARLPECREADYTTGIFQSIGFKEFHDYLVMSVEEREMEAGKAALARGIEDMKRATRQYARKQNKWIVNRFLKRRGSVVPSIYSVDSTDASQWQSRVYEPASRIVQAFIQGAESPETPLPFQENDNHPVYEKCDVCDVVLLTSQQWQYHVNGRRHKKNVERKYRLHKLETLLKNIEEQQLEKDQATESTT